MTNIDEVLNDEKGFNLIVHPKQKKIELWAAKEKILAEWDAVIQKNECKDLPSRVIFPNTSIGDIYLIDINVCLNNEGNKICLKGDWAVKIISRFSKIGEKIDFCNEV